MNRKFQVWGCLLLLALVGCQLRGIKLRGVFQDYLETTVHPEQRVKKVDYQVLNLEYFAHDPWMIEKFDLLAEGTDRLSGYLEEVEALPDSGLRISPLQQKLALRRQRQEEYTATFAQRALYRGEVNAYGIYHLLDSIGQLLPGADRRSRAAVMRAYDQAGFMIGQYGKIRVHYRTYFVDEITLWTRDRLYHNNRLAPYWVTYELEGKEKEIFLEFDRKAKSVTRYLIQSEP